MKATIKAFQAILATIAGFIVLGSPHTQQAVDPGDRTFPVIMGVLVVLSVAFLHWLLVRHVTAADLLSSGERTRLASVGQSSYQRSFFRGTVGIGYLLVLGYASDIAGFRLHPESGTSLGYFFVGVVFLFLGLVARARGVIMALLDSRRELPQPIA